MEAGDGRVVGSGHGNGWSLGMLTLTGTEGPPAGKGSKRKGQEIAVDPQSWRTNTALLSTSEAFSRALGPSPLPRPGLFSYCRCLHDRP